MPPKTEIQNKEIRKNKRELIMMTALELFSVNGYHATTINTIAKKAHISKGLLYNYFKGKEELLHTIFLEGLKELFSSLDIEKDKKITKKEMKQFISISFNMIKKNTYFWKLYFSLILQPTVTKIIEKDITDFLENFQVFFVDFFKQEGYKNPIAESRFIYALLDGIGIHYIIDPENFPLNDALEKIYTIYSL